MSQEMRQYHCVYIPSGKEIVADFKDQTNNRTRVEQLETINEWNRQSRLSGSKWLYYL